jgi:uncharacterized protein involved in exopolysaccharide biosynthesis
MPPAISPAEMESELKLVSSGRVLQKVIDEFGLTFEPAFSLDLAGYLRDWSTAEALEDEDPRAVEDAERTQKLRAMRDNLTVERDPLASVISISYSSTDPAEAARVADGIARYYLADRVTAKRQEVSETAEHLRRSVDEMGDWLKSAEGEIERYRADADLYAVDGASPVEQRYTTLSEQLTEARISLTEAESRRSQADEALANGKALDSIREVQTSPVIGDLRGQESEIRRRMSDLRTQYGDNHPIMKNAKAELAGIDRSIDAEVERVMEQLQLEVIVAGNRVKTIEDQLKKAQAELSESQASRIRLRELERNVAGPRRVYELMLDRYQRAREQEKVLTDKARIIEKASVPDEPSQLSGILLIGITAFGASAAGVGLALLQEIRRTGYAEAAEVEEDLARCSAWCPRCARPRSSGQRSANARSRPSASSRRCAPWSTRSCRAGRATLIGAVPRWSP